MTPHCGVEWPKIFDICYLWGSRFGSHEKIFVTEVFVDHFIQFLHKL